MPISKNLNDRQVRAIDRLGDRLIPGDRDLPSFSSSRCVENLDRILDFMPASDLKDLGLLLTILSFMPGPFLAFFVWLLEKSPKMGGPLGDALRFVRIGIRGLILSLYYAHPSVLQVLGYKVSVYTADLGGRRSEEARA